MVVVVGGTPHTGSTRMKAAAKAAHMQTAVHVGEAMEGGEVVVEGAAAVAEAAVEVAVAAGARIMAAATPPKTEGCERIVVQSHKVSLVCCGWLGLFVWRPPVMIHSMAF